MCLIWWGTSEAKLQLRADGQCSSCHVTSWLKQKNNNSDHLSQVNCCLHRKSNVMLFLVFALTLTSLIHFSKRTWLMWVSSFNVLTVAVNFLNWKNFVGIRTESHLFKFGDSCNARLDFLSKICLPVGQQKENLGRFKERSSSFLSLC